MSEFDDTDGDEETPDPRRPPGRRPSRSGIVNLGINVGLQSVTDLLDSLGVGGVSHRPQGEPESRGGRERAERDAWPPDSESDQDAATQPPEDYLVDTHRTTDEFVVTAELPGVSGEDLDIGIDVQSNDLVIAVEGQAIERIPLPWSSTNAAKVWFNNGVLEVRLEPVGTHRDDEDPDSKP